MKKIFSILCILFSILSMAQLPVLELPGAKKAFPGAFGYGEGVTGGRGGTILEVTNLNNSGAGSLRQALTTTGARIIFVKVSGVINLTSDIVLNTSHSDFTLLGQTAVGKGITVTGGALGGASGNTCNNYIIRGVTWRSNSGTVSNTDTFSWVGGANEVSGYIDHCSLSYGFDETVTIYSQNPDTRVTVAYTLQAEGHQDHNRGGIMGSAPTNPPTGNAGKFTTARNMYYNIISRHPNWAGQGGNLEVYNNLIVNWAGRLTRTNGATNVDWFNNYGESGNHSKTTGPDAPATNKFGWETSADDDARFYTAGNIIQGYNTDPNSDQKNLWTYFYNSGGGKNKGVQVGDEFFVGSRIGSGSLPPNGLFTGFEIRSKVLSDVGNNSGTDINGEPDERRDGKDVIYKAKTSTGTTESTYRNQAAFDIPSVSSATQYTDTTVEHLPNAWVATHGITTIGQVKATYTFPNYIFNNTQGYEAWEIFASYVIGDFDRMIEGVIDPFEPSPAGQRSSGSIAKTSKLKTL